VIWTPRGLAVRCGDHTAVSWSPAPQDGLLEGDLLGVVSEEQAIFMWACWSAGATSSVLRCPHYPEDIPTAVILSLKGEETVVPFLDPPFLPRQGEGAAL